MEALIVVVVAVIVLAYFLGRWDERHAIKERDAWTRLDALIRNAKRRNRPAGYERIYKGTHHGR